MFGPLKQVCLTIPYRINLWSQGRFGLSPVVGSPVGGGRRSRQTFEVIGRLMIYHFCWQQGTLTKNLRAHVYMYTLQKIGFIELADSRDELCSTT